VGRKADVDALAKRRHSCSYRESNTGCPALSLVTIPTELPLGKYVVYKFRQIKTGTAESNMNIWPVPSNLVRVALPVRLTSDVFLTGVPKIS
jgi:hypothetical protein